tara:strand:+ start:10029 stop:11033 length:1005 start_codon:yes stop_codon:yes gene_type:complete
MAKKLSRREEKLAAIRKADRDRDSEFDNLTFEEGRGAIKTRERVGQYKRNRQGARDMSGSKIKRGDQTETYKKSDDSTETFDRLESGADKKTRSKRKQRALDRETLRDARRERRATRIADRKGMSVSQAQDFMNNRKDRLNAAMGEFGKGLFGIEQDLSRIKDREYRKRGKGTRAEDYKPFADSNTRTKSTYYDNVIGKEDLKKSNVTLEGGEIKIPKIKPIKPPGKIKKGKQQQTIDLTLSKPLETTLEPTTAYSAIIDGNTFDNAMFTRAQGEANMAREDEFDFSPGPSSTSGPYEIKSGIYSDEQENSPNQKRIDRSTVQGNMMNAKGRRG